MNRNHNRINTSGESEMDLSNLIHSGNNMSNTASVRSNVTPNINHRNSIPGNNDPIQAFINDPEKASREQQRKENNMKAEHTNKTTAKQPIIQSNIPEIEGKTVAFIPFTTKDGKVSFHSFSIQTKVKTNVDVDYITPPYVNQSNKNANTKSMKVVNKKNNQQ